MGRITSTICALVLATVTSGIPNSANALMDGFGKVITDRDIFKTITPTHKVKSGETLSGIALEHYGDGRKEIYNCVASYNGIDAHVIGVGDNIGLPSYCDYSWAWD